MEHKGYPLPTSGDYCICIDVRAPALHSLDSQNSCMDLRTGSDLCRSGTGVGPGSELKMGHICMGTFKEGRTCKGPGPGSGPVPNWKSGGPCNYGIL